jgi:hypothetical protein
MKKIRFSQLINLSFVALAMLVSGCNNMTKNGQNETGIIEWPEIHQETKPWTRWWWHGSAVNEKDITIALEAYKKAGLGGVEITPIYGVRGAEGQFIDFLSAEWMDKFVYTLNEAKRIGLGVDLANASGWPFGGPWVDQEMACKNMVSKTFKLKGGQSLTEKIEYVQSPLLRTQGQSKAKIEDIKEPVTENENLQEYAFDQVRYKKELPIIIVTASKVGNNPNEFSETLDITVNVKKGFLDWVAPDGEWLICALFQGDHGKMVERAGPGGEGNVIDHFSSETIEKYLNHFDKAFSGYDISYLRHYFNDSYEVDDAVGESNWTSDFFAEFHKINGYDLKKHIPALLGLADENTNSRVLYDYRKTISDLLLYRYTHIWQSWANKQGKGIRNQSHGSPANALDLYAASDIPEIEGRNILELKSAPSAAHITGKNLASSESATWLNEHFESNLDDVKTALDRFFLAGVNHVFYHGTTYSPQNAPWPGWLFYAAVHFTPANSLWTDFEALNMYGARTQSFLQAGKPSNDILLYYNIADLWSSKGNSLFYHFHTFDDVSMKDCGDFFLKNGYSWDAISDKQLLDVEFTKSKFVVGGNTYQTIVIPETKYIPFETFEQLLNLAKQGATVLFYKNMPSEVPGLSNMEQNITKLETALKSIKFSDNNCAQIAQHGKGKIAVSDNISCLMNIASLKPESMYEQKLQCIRRQKADGNYYYFILNPTSEYFSDWISLNADYESVAIYNPMTGKDGFAMVRKNIHENELFLQLKPNESIIIETFSKKHSGDYYPIYKATVDEIMLKEWTVSFTKGGPVLPQTITTSELNSWTEYGEEYATFSGTAEYTTDIPPLLQKVDAWLLNLPEVHESAAIYLNDEYLGTSFCKPYSMEIPAKLFKGNDKLVVKVSNLMANRIIDMDKKGIEWRIFYNTNFNARIRNNVGKDGRFTAENWSPKASGIVGTVTLKGLSEINSK